MQTSQPKDRKYKIEDDLHKTNQKYRTICEVHRQAYEALADLEIPLEKKDLLQALIAEAYDYAKRMNKKLEHYFKEVNPGADKKWHSGFFQK